MYTLTNAHPPNPISQILNQIIVFISDPANMITLFSVFFGLLLLLTFLKLFSFFVRVLIALVGVMILASILIALTGDELLYVVINTSLPLPYFG